MKRGLWRFQDAPRLETWAGRGWALIGGVSIRTKILGIVLVLTTVLGLGVTWQVRLVMKQVFIGELENRGSSVTSDLASRSLDPILLNDTYALYELLQDTVSNHPDAVYAFVVDDSGEVLAHTFGAAGFPSALLTLNPVVSGDNQPRHLLYASNEGNIHDFAAPVFGGRAGIMRLGLSENRLRGIINGVTVQMLLTTVLVSLAGILAAMILTWLLTRPILDLVQTTRQVGQGDLAAQAPHWADDEIGDLADAFNQMVLDLKASYQEIADKEAARTRLLNQLINAQEEERKRISRELHDGVGQALTSLMVGMKVASQLDSVQAVREQSEEMRLLIMNNLEQVRLLSRQLRPSVLDDLGLAAALERYIGEFHSLYPGIAVDLHCDLPQRLPASVEIALYRIIQESMTNAARHGGGQTISILITLRNGQVQAIVEDNGCGFDPVAARRSGSSVGLHSMRERAELLGGRLDIESGQDGTTIYIEAPL